MLNGVRGCTAVVLLLTRSTLTRPYVHLEVRRADSAPGYPRFRPVYSSETPPNYTVFRNLIFLPQMRAAMTVRKPIVVVHDPDDRSGGGDLRAIIAR